jgi:hypothetical protein
MSPQGEVTRLYIVLLHSEDVALQPSRSLDLQLIGGADHGAVVRQPPLASIIIPSTSSRLQQYFSVDRGRANSAHNRGAEQKS